MKSKTKKIALIAHDNLKATLLAWAAKNKKALSKHFLFATATTGGELEKNLKLKVHKFKSGPLGGDLQIGAKIAEGEIDMMIFFWDPLSPHSHDVDVKALLRIAAVYDIPLACNRATADYILNSSLM
jgi:methylglyoxal synthase